MDRTVETSSAPDFTLVDTHGNSVRLSEYRGKKNVVLVLMRGLT